MKRNYEIHQIDAFTHTLFGGNPTVTVVKADSLSNKEMQLIAREMNLSETGFIIESRKADFRLRFFTPAGSEIKFCGHATLGALCTIAKKKLYSCQEKKNFFLIETQAGIIKAEIDLTVSDSPQFIFDAPKIELVPAKYSVEEIVKGLGISKELLDFSKPVLLEKTNNYLYLMAPNLESLGKITLDIPRTIQFARQDQIVIFCIFTSETFDPSYHIHARGFAPLVGVPEDPFTGSMQGGLAAYAIEQQVVSSETKLLRVEQGHFMQRPGFVELEISQQNPIQVKLKGGAVHVFESILTLNLSESII